MTVLSNLALGLGALLWLWGTAPLLGRAGLLVKLHGLTVADTLGSTLILVGLLLRGPREWPLLLLALAMLMIWSTLLGFVLAAQAPLPFERPQR